MRRFPPGREPRRRSATTSCCAISTEILARREELGRLLSREEGKTLPEGIGEAAPGRADLRLLRRRSLEDPGREIRERQAERRHRGHARAARRRRHHRALELPDRDPRLEDRAGSGLRQHGRVQARRSCPRLAPMRWLKSSCAPACPRGCSISSSGAARWSARRSSTTKKSTRSRSLARSRPAPRSRPPAPRPCAGSSSKWAARIRSSCSPTPTSRPRSNARSTAPISRPASAAPRRRASSSRSRSICASPTR